MNEEEECLQEVPSLEDRATPDFCPNTYATLVPLQPLSPLSTSSSDKMPAGSFDGSAGAAHQPGYGFGGLDGVFDASSYLNKTYDRDDGYDFLEPLMPIALLDDCGNAHPCAVAPSSSYSLFSQCALLPPECDQSLLLGGKCTGIGDVPSQVSEESSMQTVPLLFSNGMQSSHDSTRSSRTSSPETTCDVTMSSSPKDHRPMSAIADFGCLDSSGVEFEEINTKEIAEKISNELKKYNIPQVLFAQKILGRSQGTLSDLLRNPKPWMKLKSGRETFTRMWKWLQEPEYQRLSILQLAGNICS